MHTCVRLVLQTELGRRDDAFLTEGEEAQGLAVGGKRPILVDVVLGTLFAQDIWSQGTLGKMVAGYL